MPANSFAAIRPHVVMANHAAEFIRPHVVMANHAGEFIRPYSPLFVGNIFRYNSTVLFIYNLSNIIFYIYALFLFYVYIYQKYLFIMQYNAFLTKYN